MQANLTLQARLEDGGHLCAKAEERLLCWIIMQGLSATHEELKWNRSTCAAAPRRISALHSTQDKALPWIPVGVPMS